MTRQIRVTSRAQRQILRALEWWAMNREKAPDALDEEWDEALKFIESNPHAGRFSNRQRRGTVRCVTFERSRYDLYYRVRRERRHRHPPALALLPPPSETLMPQRGGAPAA